MTFQADRFRELAQLVRYHSDLYYNQNKPEITDAEFDTIVDELRALVDSAESQGIVDTAVADGEMALAEVGSVPTYGKKVTHSAVMGSLDKETTTSGIEGWLEKYAPATFTKLALTPKIDGCAMRLNFSKGNLNEGATRGSGIVGQDVTDNVRAVKSIPKMISYKGKVEVRGEAYMKRSVFDDLRNSGGKKLANPRNAAGGSILAKDPKETGERNLSFYVYDVIVDGITFKTESEKYAWMVNNLPGFEVVPMRVITMAEFASSALTWEVNRPTLDCEIDGLVIAFDSIELQQEAGWNGNKPRGKMAYKFKPEQKTAKVLGIDWQVGRTGRLTPMCRIEPTLVAGSTISNITLHNVARLRELKIDIGDEVVVAKMGDVIPGIVKNLSNK